MDLVPPGSHPALLAALISAHSGTVVAETVRAFAFTGEVTPVDRPAPGAAGVTRLTDTAEPGGRLAGWFAYPAATADADPRPGRGRYELQTALGAGFRLETEGGEAGLGVTDYGRATVEVIDGGPRGNVFRIAFLDSWGVIAFTLELADATGRALATDALPTNLDLWRFDPALLDYADLDRFAGTRVGFTGRLTALEAGRQK